MEICNKEYIKLINKGVYSFVGIDRGVYYLKFDENTKEFNIIYENNSLNYILKCKNSYRNPDLKKVLMAYKYRNKPDNYNIFHYEDLKIVNISTTYDSYYDEKSKRTIYTKIPKYYSYLLEYDNKTYVLSYNDKLYSLESINLSNDIYDYF